MGMMKISLGNGCMYICFGFDHNVGQESTASG